VRTCKIKLAFKKLKASLLKHKTSKKTNKQVFVSIACCNVTKTTGQNNLKKQQLTN